MIYSSELGGEALSFYSFNDPPSSKKQSEPVVFADLPPSQAISLVVGIKEKSDGLLRIVPLEELSWSSSASNASFDDPLQRNTSAAAKECYARGESGHQLLYWDSRTGQCKARKIMTVGQGDHGEAAGTLSLDVRFREPPQQVQEGFEVCYWNVSCWKEQGRRSLEAIDGTEVSVSALQAMLYGMQHVIFAATDVRTMKVVHVAENPPACQRLNPGSTPEMNATVVNTVRH